MIFGTVHLESRDDGKHFSILNCQARGANFFPLAKKEFFQRELERRNGQVVLILYILSVGDSSTTELLNFTVGFTDICT
jgi:hypothetical protein